MSSKYQEYAKAILQGIDRYKEYHLSRYLAVNDIAILPDGVERPETIRVTQQNMPFMNRVWPDIPLLDKYRKLLSNIALPIDVSDVCAPLDAATSRFFGVSRFESLLRLPDVCYALGVALYNKQIHPRITIHHKGNLISESILREMVRSKMEQCNHHAQVLTKKYHANVTTFIIWLRPNQPDYDTITDETYQENIYAVLLSAVDYINS